MGRNLPNDTCKLIICGIWILVTMQGASNCYPQPAMSAPEEDVKDSVLPRSYWQAWWNWESTKKEFETIATKAGVIWFVDEDEVVKRILEVVCRDEIAMAITYQEAEHDTFKEGRATNKKERCLLTGGTTCQKRNTESRVCSLRACFTVSPFGGLPVFCLVGFVCFWVGLVG